MTTLLQAVHWVLLVYKGQKVQSCFLVPVCPCPCLRVRVDTFDKIELCMLHEMCEGQI